MRLVMMASQPKVPDVTNLLLCHIVYKIVTVYAPAGRASHAATLIAYGRTLIIERPNPVFADASALFSTPEGHAAMMAWYDRSLTGASLPYESITVPTRYGHTHMIAAGPASAPPVILLHGMEGNAASWRHQLTGLADRFRLYALDIVGSAGKSAPARLSHDNHEYGEWLGDVLTGLGLERASLVGISNGSWLILKFAAYAPERVERAALMSANGVMPVRFPYRLARLMDYSAVRAAKDVLAGALLTPEMVRIAVTRMAMADEAVDAGEVEWFYLLAKHYRFRFPPGPVSDAELASLRAPSLLLMGEGERFFDVDAVIERVTRLAPNAVAEKVSGVGHNMCTDNPAMINARLRDFLAGE
jgi:pimeloyl-ACP methyl ester carboxylesterase